MSKAHTDVLLVADELTEYARNFAESAHGRDLEDYEFGWYFYRLDVVASAWHRLQGKLYDVYVERRRELR